MSPTTEQLLNTVAAMTVNEIVDLTKAIEDKFGVKASDVKAESLVGFLDSTQLAEEEQTEFDVVLKEVGETKIKVIKIVRAITNLGLKESKDLTEPGAVIVRELSKEDAELTKKSLEDAGATVVLK